MNAGMSGLRQRRRAARNRAAAGVCIALRGSPVRWRGGKEACGVQLTEFAGGWARAIGPVPAGLHGAPALVGRQKMWLVYSLAIRI
jgi:hypothetical protein